MKRFLACVATAIAICIPLGLVYADEENSAGTVRLSDDPAPPPPVPHVIGSDDEFGRAMIGDGGPSPYPGPYQYIPEQNGMYQEYIGAGDASVGVRTPGDIYNVQYRLNRQFGALYGYDGGYTDIGLFIPRIIDEDSIFFVDFRGFVTDDRDGGLNLGLGRRRYDAYHDRVWSHGLWLDYDGGHVENYLRGGYSGSMTSRYWRYRWNGYWIMNENNHIINTQLGSDPFYSGSNIMVDRLRTREVAYSGVDATIGGPIPLLGRFGLNWDFGLYYNTGEGGEDGVGFLAKADAQITEDISLGVSYSDDKVFGSNAQMSLAINFPDGRNSSFLRQPRVHDYMLRSDSRNYRVSTQRFLVEDSVDILNDCGLPYQVAHIDPADTDGATPSGDGTAENPFNSLAAWEALSDVEKAQYGIVLVRPGTEVSTPDGIFHANLNTGITIGEHQRLLATSGRLVREIDDDGNAQIVFADHQFNGFVEGLGYLQDLLLPSIESDSLAGTVWTPGGDYNRPILSNHDSIANPNAPHAVVTISNEFSAICDVNPTEVSGFEIDGYNPNLPTQFNNGIVSGNYGDPLIDRGINGFDINSNFVYDSIHAINLISVDDGVDPVASGNVSLNQIEGNGFYSNSGIHVEHIQGTLNLNVQDNLVYGIGGEDIDNDGILITSLPGGLLSEDGITNLNHKLDIGEDTNGDGLISVVEDNDKDGVIGSDDHGIAINLIADDGAIINANNSIIRTGDGSLAIANISRNTTWVSEADLGRDVNGYVNYNNFNTQDTIDTIGNRSGINMEANNGATFNAVVADNDTSNNNPWADYNAAGDFVAPEKNQDMAAIPEVRIPQLPELDGDGTLGNPTNPILSNGFGIRAAANGAGSTMTLSSPDRHLSNNNYGNGAVFSARNGGTFDMLSPMLGEFVVDSNGFITDVVAASEFNNNGLEGLLITGDGAGSSLDVHVGAPLAAYITDNPLTTGVNEAANVDTLLERLLNQFNGNGSRSTTLEDGNGIRISMTDNSVLTGGIYGSDASFNRQDGIAFSVNNSNVDNFMIDNNRINSNGFHGIHLDFVDAPTTGLTISNNEISDNAQILQFLIDGDTFTDPYLITNNYAAGGTLAQFILNLTPADLLFDTVEPQGSTPFQPQDGSDVTTGLTSVNGNLITPGTDPLEDENGVVLVGGGVADNSQILNLIFSDFGVGEEFSWLIDVDPTGGTNTVLGSDLVGATVQLVYSSGETINGTLSAIAGNPDASQFVATGLGNDGDGIHVNLVNSTMTDLVIADNTINQNANDGIEFVVNNSNLANTLIESNIINGNGGDGIRLMNPDFATNGPGVNEVIYSLNEINENQGHGINMVLDNDNELDTVICVNDISGNALGGINVELSDDAYYDNGTFDSPLGSVPFIPGNSFSGNTINDNGGIGYHIDANDRAQFELIGSTPLHNTVNGNQDAGIGIDMSGSTKGTVVLDNISVDGTLDDDNGDVVTDDQRFNGDGIAILMNGQSQLTDVRTGTRAGHDVLPDTRIGDLTDMNTSVSDNFGDGIRIDIRGQARILDGADADDYGTIISNAVISNNGNGNVDGVGNGIAVVRNGDALLDDVWIRGSTFQNNNADGIDIQIFGGANSPVTGTPFSHNFLIGGTDEEDSNTFLANNVNQIDLLTGADGIMTVDILNNMMAGTYAGQQTTGDGIEATSTNFGQILGTWQGNTILDSGTHGISIVDGGAGEGSAPPITTNPRINVSIYENIIQRSGADGINILGTAVDQPPFDDDEIDVVARIDDNIITDNEGNGIRIYSNSETETLIETMDRNTVADNGLSGLSVQADGSGDVYIYQVIENIFSDNELHGVELLTTNEIAGASGLLHSIRVGRRVGDDLVNYIPVTSYEVPPGSGGALIEAPNSGFVDNIVTDNGQDGYHVVLNNAAGGGSLVGGAYLTVRIAGTTNPTGDNGATATSLIAGNGGNGIRLENNATSTNRSAYLNASIVNNAVIGNGTKTLEAGETVDELNGIYLKAGTTTIGETNAQFLNNYVSGSGNIDFVFHTFAATPDPTTQNDNSPDLGQIDPLARVNIRFEGNKGGSLDVMRDSDFLRENGNATYNNADSWKSPVYYFNGPTSSGIERVRNATRERWTASTATIEDPSFDRFTPPNPTATTVTMDNLLNRNWAGAQIRNGGSTFDVVSSSYNSTTGLTTLTLVDNRNGAIPPAGNYEIYFPSVAGVGDTTLRLFGSNNADLLISGANGAGGNNFTTIISDFNQTGLLSVGSSDPINVPGQDQWFEFDTTVDPIIFQP